MNQNVWGRQDATDGSRPSWPVVLIVTTAMLVRMVWRVVHTDVVGGGEAFMVAHALASGRGFSDAYQIGQGPTAHLLPISPMMAGGIYYLFGDGAIGSAILSGFSISCAVASFLLFFKAFDRLGMPYGARLAAFGVLALFPTYLTQEVFDFRAWEGGLAMLAAAAFLERLLALADLGWDWLHVTILAALGALAFFINPIEGIALLAAGALAMAGQGANRMAGAGAIAIAFVAALVVPWTWRNARMLGSPVLLRSNAGLELALADRPDAVSGEDEAARYITRLNAIHPRSSIDAYRRMMATGGEIAYSHALGQTTGRWLRAHPGAAARLAMRHVGEFLLPPAWAFRAVGTDGFARLRAMLADAAMLLCIVSLTDRLRRGDRRWSFVALMIALPAMATAPFQPIARYCYLVWAPSVFCASDGISRFLSFARRRVSVARPAAAAGSPVPRKGA